MLENIFIIVKFFGDKVSSSSSGKRKNHSVVWSVLELSDHPLLPPQSCITGMNHHAYPPSLPLPPAIPPSQPLRGGAGFPYVPLAVLELSCLMGVCFLFYSISLHVCSMSVPHGLIIAALYKF